MFELPSHWQRLRLKYVATINDDVLPEDTDPDYNLLYVDIGDVSSQGDITGQTAMRFENAPSRARRKVRHNDVIVSTVRTYLTAIAPIDSPPNNLVISTGFAVVRPKSGLDGRFCKYALRSTLFVDEVVRRSLGVSYPAITSSELADISICIPPLIEQQHIAAYLDSEIESLDKLLEEKKQFLKLLELKRVALIAHAVTRGLDKNAPLKSTGIQWLGDVPEHWGVERSRWLFQERDERSMTGEEELLTVSHLTGVTTRAEKEVHMFKAETLEGYKICHYGDLVINTMWAWMGAMGTASQTGIVSPSYNVYEPSTQYDCEYVDFLSRTPAFVGEVTSRSKGVWSSRLRLYPDSFFHIYFPVPPLSEQRAIVAYLGGVLSKIDELNAVLIESLDLLAQRRAALITEAVTGRLIVST